MILEKFGWSWEYLLWGIRYPLVMKMLADAPWVDYKKSGADGKPVKGKKKMTFQEGLAAMVNKMPK